MKATVNIEGGLEGAKSPLTLPLPSSICKSFSPQIFIDYLLYGNGGKRMM